MSAPEESNHPDDFLCLTVDIDNCPKAEIPLTEIYNINDSTLKIDYLTTLCDYITQQLEDTSWFDDQSLSPLFDAGFATFYQKPNGDLISLRKPALQRLIKQTIQYRNGIVNPIAVPVYIKFMVPDSGLPRKPQSTMVPSIIEGVANASEETAPSELLTPPGGTRSIEGTNNPGRLQFQGATPLLDEDTTTNPPQTSFRGIHIDLHGQASAANNQPDDDGIATMTDSERRYQNRILPRDNPDPRRPRGRLNFDDAQPGDTPRTQTTNLTGRTHTSHSSLT
jgi:hypothetical protein